MTGAPWRAVFFEEEHAHAVAMRLLSDGFVAEVVRERLAGEDDEEGQPWAVLSDAPQVMVELLVDRYDGWLDVAPETSAPPLPDLPPLPSAPRTRHRRETGAADGSGGAPS